MKALSWLGLMILIFIPAPLIYAQTGVQLGPEQIPGTSTTDSVKRTKEIGPKGQVIVVALLSCSRGGFSSLGGPR